MNKIFHISKNCRKGTLRKAHYLNFMSLFAGTKICLIHSERSSFNVSQSCWVTGSSHENNVLPGF